MKLNKVVEICEVCNSSDTLMFQSFVYHGSFRMSFLFIAVGELIKSQKYPELI